MGKKRIIILIFVSLLLISSISALRISPARIEGNFRPGMEIEINYSIDSSLNRYLEMYVKGDLAEYVTFSENKIFKRGSVVAIMKLPDNIEPPGPQRTHIGVRELADEELATGGVGTAIGIEALILIHVPYPGKYLESSLTTENVNIGEPVEFNLHVVSRGTEDLTMNPRIEIYSDKDELLETLELKEREVKSGETIDLKKEWNTTGYLAGNYYALSEIDYDVRTAESRADFRVGDLVINILNYSDSIVIGGIRQFWIEIQSGWNNKIDGAFADVVIYNKTGEITRFRTSPTDLEPWQSNRINGYFDTDLFESGKYDANATVTYYGREQGRSKSEILKIKFVKEDEINYLIIIGVSFGILIFLIALFFIFIRFKHGNKRR